MGFPRMAVFRRQAAGKGAATTGDSRSVALRSILRHAASVPLYRERYLAAGVPPHAVESGDLESHFACLPTLEPEELIARSQLLRASSERAFRVTCSGGSCGVPKVLYRTAADWDASVRNMVRVLRTADLRQTDSFLIVQPFGIWAIGHLALDACREIGCVAAPVGIHHDGAQILDFMDRFGVTAVFATPSLWKSITSMRDASKRRVPVRVLTAGEKLSASDREFLSAWGGGVRELYGSEETDGLAAECGRAPGMHMLEDSFLFELIGASGPIDHSKPGVHEGELVITSLYHRGTPLVRYRLGDMVRIHRCAMDCACGSTEPRLEILGRRGQRLQLFDATKVYLYQVEAAARCALERDVSVQLALDDGPGATEILHVLLREPAGEHEVSRVREAVARSSLDLADSVARGQVDLRVTAGSGIHEASAKGKQHQIIDRRTPRQRGASQ